jgi:uncharacterized YigZ family protein
MLFDSDYKTISKTTEGVFKEKGSKFIALCKPISSVEDFKNWLVEIKSNYTGAVHYCYAYRIGYDKQLYRINDDGEPSGSAGRPIYNVIQSNELTNIGIVVVRYFGGTLLGVPGLINAYKQSSIEALHQNVIITKSIIEKLSIEFAYEKMNEAMRVIKEHQLKIIKQESAEHYYMEVEVPIKNAEQVRSAFQLYSISYKYLETY